MLKLSNILHLEARKENYVSRELVEGMPKFLHEKLLGVLIDDSFSGEDKLRVLFEKLKGHASSLET